MEKKKEPRTILGYDPGYAILKAIDFPQDRLSVNSVELISCASEPLHLKLKIFLNREQIKEIGAELAKMEEHIYRGE